MTNSKQLTNNGQIHGYDHVSLEIIFEILDKILYFDIKVVISATDECLIRLGVGTIGDKIRLREACRRIYT